MSRSVTLAQLRTRAFRRADMPPGGTGQIGTSEANDTVNDELCDLYDFLVQAGPPDYYAATTVIATSAGVIPYALPVDLYRLSAVYANETSTYQRALRPVNEFMRAAYQAPQGTYSMTVEYVPVPPTLINDSDVFDGVAGWDRLITALVARRFLQKRKADTSQIEREIADLKARIRTASSNRDRGAPRYLTDAEGGYWYPYTIAIDGYRLRGGNIEFYAPLVVWP